MKQKRIGFRVLGHLEEERVGRCWGLFFLLSRKESMFCMVFVGAKMERNNTFLEDISV